MCECVKHPFYADVDGIVDSGMNFEYCSRYDSGIYKIANSLHMSQAQEFIINSLAVRVSGEIAQKIAETLNDPPPIGWRESGLTTLWEAICAESQHGDSYRQIDANQKRIVAAIEHELSLRPAYELFSLWLRTPSGKSWISAFEQTDIDLHDPEGRLIAPIGHSEIAEYIFENAFSELAETFTNERIALLPTRRQLRREQLTDRFLSKDTVWWRPEGENDSILTAVRIKPGLVTESDWLDALEDRVQFLVTLDDDPDAALRDAVSYLNRESDLSLMSGKAIHAGQILVGGNLALQSSMGVNNPEFPLVAEENISEPDHLDDLNLWIEAASASFWEWD